MEFEFGSKTERVDSMIETINKSNSKIRGVSSNPGHQPIYTQKQLTQIKSQSGMPPNREDKLLL